MTANAPWDERAKRALVHEAVFRTPAGGFPELEEREGLEPGTLFDWVEQYGPPRPPLPFSSLHFWVGTSELSEEQFSAYFEYDDAYWDLEVEDVEASAQDVTGCGFCIDTGMRFLYDEDLLQVMWFDEPVPVRELIGESTLATDAATDVVVAACHERGIRTANAGFVYADPTFTILEPAKPFHGLAYIGLFASKVSSVNRVGRRPMTPRVRSANSP